MITLLKTGLKLAEKKEKGQVLKFTPFVLLLCQKWQ